MKEKLWLGEAIKKFDKKFEKGTLNIINAFAGSGKTHFISEEFLKNTDKYAETRGYKLNMNLNKVLYVTDTVMLKKSILANDDIRTKELEKGALKEATKKPNGLMDMVKDMETGRMLVITYANLGFLLKNPGAKYILLNHFSCIIFDEIHNLFRYADRFDSETNSNVNTTVVDNLNEITKNVLSVALTATMELYKMENREINYKVIFADHQLKRIRKYKNKKIEHVNNTLNCVKEIFNLHKDDNTKILIYTKLVKTAEKYKQLLNKYGINTEYLCSENNENFNKDKVELREQLLKTGLYPDDLRVLIINGAYETGWNLRDKRVQVVMIDSTDEVIQVQARNRCRFDIRYLYLKSYYDKDGVVQVKRAFGELEDKIIEEDGKQRFGFGIIKYNFIDCLDKKYVGIKLTKKLKDEMVERYGTVELDGKNPTFLSLKSKFEEVGYIIKNDRNATYIFEKGNEMRKDSKKVAKKMERILKHFEEVKGKKLEKKEQTKIIKIVDLYKKDGKIQDKPNKLNEYLRSVEIGYIILSKSVNGKRVWIIEETEI